MIDELMTVLESFESAPSAHILVKSFVANLSDSEIDSIYNSSEGYNDQCTEEILSSMSSSKLQDLVQHLKEIDLEYRNELDEEEYNESYGYASSILSNL
jgi:hypothetical protein